MANKYAIAMQLNLIDGVSKQLDAISEKGSALTGVFSKSLNAAQERVNTFGRVVKVGMETALVTGATTAVGALASAVKSGAEQFIDLDNAITSAGAMFKDLDPTSNTFRESLDALQQTALDVAGKTEFMATDTAGALQKMAMAGMTAQQSMELLMGTTNLATAAGTDLTTAVDIATDALGAFSLDATAENLQRVSDVMAKTTTTANTGLTDMFEAIKYAGPGFTAAGQSVETLAASIGILANAGTKGSSAGTHLQALFTQFSKKAVGTEKSKGLLDFGIQVFDEKGAFRSLGDILEQVDKVTSSMGSYEKSAFFTKMFGTQGSLAMNELLAAQMEIDGVMYKGVDAFKAYQTQLENSNGAAQIMADTMRGSLGNQIELLKSAVSTLEINFVKAFKDKGSEAIQRLTEIVSNIDVNQLIDTADAVLNKIIDVGKKIWDLRVPIMTAVGAFMAFRGVMDAIVIGSKVAGGVKMITDSFKGLKIALGIMKGNSAAKSALAFMSDGVQGAAGKWSGFLGFFKKLGSVIANAFKSLGAAMMPLLTNPVTWIVLGIVAAIAALVAIIILCVKNWDKIVAALQRAWEWLKNVGEMIGNFFMSVWESFTNWISETLLPIWNSVVDAFKGFGEMIGGFFMSVWESFTNWISETLLPIWNSVVDAFKGFGEWISNVFVSVWDGLGRIVTGIIDGIKSAWETLTSAFSSGGILGALKLIGGSILNFLLLPIQKLLDMISLIPGVGNLTSGLAESLQSFRDGLINVDTSDAGELSSTAPTKTSFEATNTINSREENVQRSEVTIGLEKGLTATPSYGAPPIVMERVRSGAF